MEVVEALHRTQHIQYHCYRTHRRCASLAFIQEQRIQHISSISSTSFTSFHRTHGRCTIIIHPIHYAEYDAVLPLPPPPPTQTQPPPPPPEIHDPYFPPSAPLFHFHSCFHMRTQTPSFGTYLVLVRNVSACPDQLLRAVDVAVKRRDNESRPASLRARRMPAPRMPPDRSPDQPTSQPRQPNNPE